MEEKHFEFLIDSLRENEEKTYEIATALNDFNGAIHTLIQSMGDLLQVDTLKEGTRNLKGLGEHLANMDDRLKQLEPSKVYLSDSAIIHEDKILVVGADRKSLYEYSPNGEMSTLRYTFGYSVKSIWSIRHKLYALSTEGEIYSVSHQNSLIKQVEEVKVCTYGMILKTTMQAILFYPLLGEPVELARDVTYFEILMEKYLLYTTLEHIQQIDLQAL